MQNKIPLFICEFCDDEANCHPSEELSVWDDKLICAGCIDDLTEDELETKPVQFVPPYEVEIKQLFKEFKDKERGFAMTLAIFDKRDILRDSLVEQMKNGLEKCRDKFSEYVKIHQAKIPEFQLAVFPSPFTGVERKVKANKDMVDFCDSIIKLTEV